MANEKLKAYVVSEKWGDAGSVVVWTTTPGKAKSECINRDEFDGYEYTELQTRRAPEWDKYAESKKIPIEEFIKNSWWFGCADCGMGELSEDDINAGDAFIIHGYGDTSDFIKGKIVCTSCKKRLENRGLTCKN